LSISALIQAESNGYQAQAR